MDRRAFLTVLTGGLLAAPPAAEAQHGGNAYTAKALDLTIPPSLLQRADQVIE